jgi:hypothetical protein
MIDFAIVDISELFLYLSLTFQNSSYITSQVFDLADKLEQVDNSLTRNERVIDGAIQNSKLPSNLTQNRLKSVLSVHDSKKGQDKLSKVIKDSSKLTGEVLHGLMGQVLKDALFNHHHGRNCVQTHSMDVQAVQAVTGEI